jgi:hypothetical protein
MRYLRWVVLLEAVAVTYACTPFVGMRPDGGGAGGDSGGGGANGPGGSGVATTGTAGESGVDASTEASATTKPNGSGCLADQECLSGHCVDSVCCATSVCSACQACNLNREGTCSPKGKGSSDVACPASATMCSAGGCDGLGSCLPAPAGTTCGNNVCQNGAPTLGHFPTAVTFGHACDGLTATAASCMETIHKNCDGNLACSSDGRSCLSACALDVDCLSGFFCKAGACTSLIATGSTIACLENKQCASRLCDNGKCVECTIDYDCRSDRPLCNQGQCVECLPSLGSYCPNNRPTCDSSNKCVCQGTDDCLIPECVSDLDCPRGDAPFCQAGKCGCAGAPCQPPLVCIASGPNHSGGRCALPVGMPCMSGSDCVSGSCDGGVCLYSWSCAVDSDCTEVCLDNICGASICVKGVCQAGCTNDYQCSAGACVDGGCLLPNEIGCLRGNDCSSPAKYCCSGEGRAAPICLKSCD